MNSPVFRASFTTLDIWAKGDYVRAVEKYFKLKKFTTRDMARGIDLHEEWADETRRTKKLPAVFGGGPLINPIVEQLYDAQIAPWLKLVGRTDCIDSPSLYEYKSGSKKSNEYASSMQPGVYGVLLTYNKLFVDRVHIHAHDQYLNSTTYSFVWLTDRRIDEALQWVITQSRAMHNYLTEHDLYRKLLPGGGVSL